MQRPIIFVKKETKFENEQPPTTVPRVKYDKDAIPTNVPDRGQRSSKFYTKESKFFNSIHRISSQVSSNELSPLNKNLANS